MAGVAQLVRALGCGSRGRGFDPRRLPHASKDFTSLASLDFASALLNVCRIHLRCSRSSA